MSTAAVLHYNFLSRIIASIACRILLIPTPGYIDDFGFFTATHDESAAMAAFTEHPKILGLSLKVEKSVIWNSQYVLGLSGKLPRSSQCYGALHVAISR